LDSAAAVCAEHGFDNSTLSLIAERAGVHPTAIYNHYETREDLLYAAAVRALEQLTAVAFESSLGLRSLSGMAAAYLQPGMHQQRRIIAELHVVSSRDERLAALLADWHRTWCNTLLEQLPTSDPDPRVTVKALFLVLLGLCHLDDLAAVRAPLAAVIEQAERMIELLVPELHNPTPAHVPAEDVGSRPRKGG
jgi:AcrR family transcriptional regulator